MTVGRPIAFQHQELTDVVTAAIAPIDGVTRQFVRSGVTVELWDPASDTARPNRLIRNLSGYLVLVDESPDQELTFRVDATAAGYRGPIFETFNPVQDGVELVVALEPRPDAPLPESATVVRGMVERSSRPLELPDGRVVPSPEIGVSVSVTLPSDVARHQFPATTDDRGVFVLVVGMKPLVSPEGTEPAAGTLRFEKPGAPTRDVPVELDHGRTHVFTSTIDLDGTNEPEFRP